MHTMHSIRSYVYYYTPSLNIHGRHPSIDRSANTRPKDQGGKEGIMAVVRMSSYGMIENGPSRLATRSYFLGDMESHSILHEDESSGLLDIAKQSLDELLLKKTRATCDRYKIEFAQLSTIQRKFLTHFRCSQCGLLPLYQINLLHIKRVRCRKCGQSVAFKRTGKYGKFRKEIAIELVKEVQRDV